MAPVHALDGESDGVGAGYAGVPGGAMGAGDVAVTVADARVAAMTSTNAATGSDSAGTAVRARRRHQAAKTAAAECAGWWPARPVDMDNDTGVNFVYDKLSEPLLIVEAPD